MSARTEYQREYYKKNREKIVKRRKEIENETRQVNKEWRENNRAKSRATLKRWRTKRRLQVLTHYGGDPPKCKCCEENTVQFLSIDHIDGGGALHRRTMNTRGGIVQFLIQNDYPLGYQILCYNCNASKGFYGSCPHKATV